MLSYIIYCLGVHLFYEILHKWYNINININKKILNSRRSFKNSLYNGSSKERSKSIYRGDQSHTLSMHIRIDNEISPDKYQIKPELHLQHKFSHK